MRRLVFPAAAWAWLALSALLADMLRLADTAGGGWLCLVVSLGGLLALRRLLLPAGGGR